MDVLNKYNFFFFHLLNTDISLIFDEYFASEESTLPATFPHYHEVWELYCISNGTLELQVSDKNYLLKKDQIFIIPPYTQHCRVSVSEDLRHTSIRFFSTTESTSQENMIDLILKKSENKVFSISSTSMLLLDQLKDFYVQYLNNSEDPWRASKITVASMHLFIDILESISKTNHIQIPLHRQKENYDLMLIEYLMLCGNPVITLKQIAQKLNYSEPQTSRIIKKKFGKPYRSMVFQFRLEKARYHLIKTDESIEEISSILGFKNPNSFFYSFKKAEGVSPSEYRRIHQSQKKS